jgi:hypothetical protein
MTQFWNLTSVTYGAHISYSRAQPVLNSEGATGPADQQLQGRGGGFTDRLS